MDNQEIEKILDSVVQKVFPDLGLNFSLNHQQWNMWTAFIMIGSQIDVDRSEVVRYDEFQLRNILTIRVKDALLKLKEIVEEKLTQF